jgi:hypothetical protein
VAVRRHHQKIQIVGMNHGSTRARAGMKMQCLRAIAALTVGCALYEGQTSAQSPQTGVAPDLEQSRKALVAIARQACFIEYENPNAHAQIMSIGWETPEFCACAEAKLLKTLSDQVTRQAAEWIARTQYELKKPEDLALLAKQPQVAEFLKAARNAKGSCIYMKMRN